MDKPKLYLIPHLPKTGGSTLIRHLLNGRGDSYELFHLGRRGRIGYHSELKHLEDYVNLDDQTKNVIVIGHQVDEGIISYFKNYEVCLLTILREPLARYVSHFNMIKPKGTFEGNINAFIKKRRRFFSLYFIDRFPSLVKDKFDTIEVQAADILDYFSLYFLEDGPDCFDRILDIFSLEYNPDLIDNRRDTNYIDYTKTTPISFASYKSTTKENLLYNKLKRREVLSFLDLPEIKTPHMWFRDYCSNFIKSDQNVRAYMIDNLEEGFMQSLLKEHLNLTGLNLDALFRTVAKYETYFVGKEALVNLEDLIRFIINDKELIVLNNAYEYENSDLRILYTAIKNSETNVLMNVQDEALLELSYRGFNLEIACSRIYISMEKHTEAERCLLSALSYKLSNPVAFYLLAKVNIKLGKKAEARKCLEKCMELKPKNETFRKMYIEL